jgi:inosine-uridine nucleoside N-ribohydrolase
MRTFLIDTNTASDDAVAILMALAASDVKVAALTVVAGNVSMAQGARNALYTCEVVGVDVPVHPGAEAPLTRDPIRQGNAEGRQMSESGPGPPICCDAQVGSSVGYTSRQANWSSRQSIALPRAGNPQQFV